MLGKILLYWNTVRYLKPSQVWYRLRKMLRIPCTFGVVPCKRIGPISPVQTVAELDFDPVFLARFPVEELMDDQITLLHETEMFRWNTSWAFPNRTPLWNYNLHYCEYLFPLVKAYEDTEDGQYLGKVKDIILAWIRQNPRQNGGMGWDPYPIALRLTNWLAVYTHLEQEIGEDTDFHKSFVHSIWDQYDHLARHLEKDLLGNHYFEDLKALVLCALFFGDDRMLKKVLIEFHKQCREQILLDGMHFELSPMYHKLILEDLIRVAVALRSAGKQDREIESYLQSMLDVAYSLEEGLERIPLFNDCGNNVAKSLNVLCTAAKTCFGLIPKYKDKFPESGYYIFKQGDWKMIVDAGQPGPAYLPGHAHCDAMSFELFHAGKPVIVNCGTYAYQCKERAFFRSTAAHNTVQVEGVEQSQCWGVFRMGKRSRIQVLYADNSQINIQIYDQKKNQIIRVIGIDDYGLFVTEYCYGQILKSTIHGLGPEQTDIRRSIKVGEYPYADEFGKLKKICSVVIRQQNKIQYRFDFASKTLRFVQTK